MKIIDCKDIDCKFLEKQFKLFDFQGYGDNSILVFNKKLLIKKTEDVNEVNNIKKIIDLVSNHNFNIFIASHYKTYLYKNNYYIFMKRYQDSIEYLKYINVNEFKNLIQQCLLFCLFLNFKIKIYHNDLHLRNCLFKNINNPILIKFEDITLEIKDKLLVVIDFNALSDKLNQRGLNGKRMLKLKSIIFNDFNFVMFYSLTKFRISSKNKVIKQKDNNLNFKNYLNILNQLNINNNLEDFIKLYKYIDNNFNQVFSF
jgi:hypothetical protein